MRESSAVLALILSAALGLSACSDTNDAAGTPPASASPTATATNAAMPQPEYEQIRVVITSHSTSLLNNDAGECVSKLATGDLIGLNYDTANAEPIELQLPDTVVGTAPLTGSQCVVTMGLEIPPVVNPQSARLVALSGSGEPEVIGHPTVERDGLETIMRFALIPVASYAESPTVKPPTVQPQDPAEAALIAAMEEAGLEVTESDIRSARRTCETFADWDDTIRPWRMLDELATGEHSQRAVEHLCPDFSDDFELAQRGVFFRVTLVRNDPDPEKAEVTPGTYITAPGVRDCYWERATGGGDIIDNGFVTAAADGIRVDLRHGETFIHESDCGSWLPVE